MTVVTRFAPSPTGFLHIGGARTALFNWLYARRHGGTFLLRIEDTDKARSTQEAIDAILDSMEWLGLKHDGDVVYQSHNEARHREVAEQLLASGNAYKCFCTQEELQTMREEAQAKKQAFQYDRRWRDVPEAEHPKDQPYVVRIKAPLEDSITIADAVQGSVTTRGSEIDDFVILRSDGTPTYMLAVVVDDHDMSVTTIIRGDDHLTNTFKQAVIYQALGWDKPEIAHVPLIHGPDGAKLSKRHGALGVDAYRDMGYLPEAMCNYLVRLGWSHGDDEIFSTEQAIEWFNLKSIGKSPARIDFDKMASVNAHYIKAADNPRLLELMLPHMNVDVDELAKTRILRAMDDLKERAKTLLELTESAKFYVTRQPITEEKARQLIEDSKDIISLVAAELQTIDDWKHDPLHEAIKNVAEKHELKMGKVMQPLRAALTFSSGSPGGMMDIMEILGKEETLARLADVG